MKEWLIRLAIAVIVCIVVVVFGLFALNFYRNYVGSDGPDRAPPVIFERTDRPSRA